MKTPMRYAAILAAIFVMVVAGTGWVGPAIVSVSSAEQASPGPTSARAGPNASRELTLEQRADVFMARKNYDDAIDYYYRALKESNFRDAVVWNKLGIAFQQNNKYRNARRAYTSATRVDKNFAEAWNNIGTVFFMEKKYAKTVQYYERAIKLKGDVAAFHMNLGSSYYHLKNYAQAVEEYRIALEIDPKVVGTESAVGTVIHAGGTDVEFYFYMAKALASVGNAEVAVRYLRRALEDGFTDRQRIEADPDFQKISQHPAFVELMRNPPVAIKD